MPELVTLHVWRVPTRGVPAAITRMAADRAHLRRTSGLRFTKSLGTGDGRTFTVRDADPRRWALLCAWESAAAARSFELGSPVVRAWARLAIETCRLDLRPVAARGRWSGRTPFGDPRTSAGARAAAGPRYAGPVAALTRARLAPARAASFWRSVPPVSADLRATPGLRLALGVGEAPIGLQGTFSVWDDAAALRAFAYGREAHTAVVARTASEGWYAEELFARFAIAGVAGSIDGVCPA